jgi:hypothetical protein
MSTRARPKVPSDDETFGGIRFCCLRGLIHISGNHAAYHIVLKAKLVLEQQQAQLCPKSELDT